MSATSGNALQSAIHKLAFREPLTADDAKAAFDVVMQGQASAVQIAALLSSLRAAGESPEVVAGVVRALRDAMVSLPADDPAALVDTCGTGGGAVSTFNISTAAAIVAAGAGVRIAKHGNRSFTSKCGSADVLEALGVPIDARYHGDGYFAIAPQSTALHVAAWRAAHEALELLLARGADPNARDGNGHTPLMRAVAAGVLGLDMNGMRGPLEKAGLRYVD